MRVLIVGSVAEGALELWYAAAFRSLGIEVSVFDPERALGRGFRGRIGGRLTRSFVHLAVEQEVKRYFAEPQAWDLVLVVKGLFLSARAVASARRRTPSAKWFCFDPDSPFDLGRGTSSRHIRECIPLYDRYFIWSHSLVPQLAAHGCREPAVYLPFGFDESHHFPAPERDASLKSTIAFVGTYDRQRAHVLGSIADLPLRIFGYGWQRVPPWSRLRSKLGGAAVLGADLRRVVTSSLCTINIMRPQNVGSHNMRTFEVPAMGGVMVTSRSAEQQEFFPEGEASLMYSDVPELRSVFARLLRGEIDTESIRRNALSAAQAHSYRERARFILEIASM